MPATSSIARVDLGRFITIAVVLLVVGLVVVLGLSFRRDPRDIRTGTIGASAPAFELERLDGAGSLRLADHRGKVVVLNFWASWCVPCKEENPVLARTWERYRLADVVLIGVLYQDSVDAGREFVRRYGNSWPSVVDPNGRTGFSYGVFGIPETYFITPDGVIAGRHIGPIDEATLARGIDAIRPR